LYGVAVFVDFAAGARCLQRFALWLLKMSLLCLQHLLKLIVATLAGMLDFVAGVKYVSVFSTSCDFTFVPGAKNLSLFFPFVVLQNAWQAQHLVRMLHCSTTKPLERLQWKRSFVWCLDASVPLCFASVAEKCCSIGEKHCKKVVEEWKSVREECWREVLGTNLVLDKFLTVSKNDSPRADVF